MNDTYIHGYNARESLRLQDQAGTLVELLHADTAYSPGCRVLEVGCGVGAQTVTLARNSPGALITSVDISESSVASARQVVEAVGADNVTFAQADIFHLPFPAASFDHVFVCFVLEHLSRPADALTRLKGIVRTGGSITVIEGDHGSAYFHPDSEFARKAIDCQVQLQTRAGGNALIGRELYPLLQRVGLTSVCVSPRMVYADSSRPALVEGFTRKTFTAMIEGVRDQAISSGLADAQTFDRGVSDLYQTAGQDGVFCYTFFKGVGIKL